MQVIAALIAGLLFGAGLTVSQMVDPGKILNFLDVAGIGRGTWDPTLAMVFTGALAAMFAAYAVQRRLPKPLLGDRFSVPQAAQVDSRLLAGSAVFGIGWGLAGVCPGPSLTALALAGSQLGNVALFVVAMMAGIVLSWGLAPSALKPATKPRS